MDRLREHPWAIDIPINGTLPTYAQLSWLNRGLEVMDGTGLADGEAADLVLLLNGYVFWALRLEVALDDRAAAATRPAAVRPRAICRTCAAGVQDRQFEDDSTPDENFRLGLNRTLDGIAASIP